MQSYAYKVKSELCRAHVQRHCCARAEAYGALLYCNTFHTKEIRFITENPEFAARLPRLFRRAFDLKFDRLPEEEACRGKLARNRAAGRFICHCRFGKHPQRQRMESRNRR